MEGFIFLKEGAMAPEYADKGSSGADVFAYIEEPIELAPGGRTLVPTGIHVALPEGYEIQVRPRSGLALKHGLTVLNTPGTIDSSYRGEIGIILMNHSQEPFIVNPGMKVAQLVAMQVETLNLDTVNSLDDLGQTERGEGGFGHTGH